MPVIFSAAGFQSRTTPARNAATRQHAYSSSPTPDRDGDERNGLGREPGARLLVALERRHQELLAGLQDLADVVPGLSGRVCRPPTGGSRRADQLAVVLDRVERAPVGELAHEQLAHLLQRRARLDRGGEQLARVPEQIKPPLQGNVLRGRLALRALQAVPLLVRTPAFGVVVQDRLRVEGLSGRVPHRRRRLPDPDDPTVTGDEAVSRAERVAVCRRGFELGEDPFPVVRVQELREEVRLGLPLPRRVPEQRLHLRADVEQRATVGVPCQPRHERSVLRKRSEFRLSVTADCLHLPLGKASGPLGPLPAGDRESGHDGQRKGDRHHERHPGPAVLEEDREHGSQQQDGNCGRQEQLGCARAWTRHGRRGRA